MRILGRVMSTKWLTRKPHAFFSKQKQQQRIKRNYVNQLHRCSGTQSKVYNNQANAQSRKSHLQNVKQFHSIFNLHSLIPSTAHSILIMSKGSLVTDHPPSTGRSRAEVICKLLCMFILT